MLTSFIPRNIKLFGHMSILVVLFLIISVQALASFRQPEGCGEMVRLTEKQKLSMADIAFRGKILNKNCRCGRGVVHCKIRYTPLENLKNAQMSRNYEIEQIYKIDFGCTRKYIDNLEKVSGQINAYFFKKSDVGLTPIGDVVCSKSM